MADRFLRSERDDFAAGFRPPGYRAAMPDRSRGKRAMVPAGPPHRPIGGLEVAGEGAGDPVADHGAVELRRLEKEPRAGHRRENVAPDFDDPTVELQKIVEGAEGDAAGTEGGQRGDIDRHGRGAEAEIAVREAIG